MDGRKKILVIDDDKLVCSSIANVARSLGYESAQAFTLEEGLDAFWAMVEHAERCVAAGLLHGEPSELGLLMWATAHGVVMLELAGFLDSDAEAVYDAATTATFAGLRQPPGA